MFQQAAILEYVLSCQLVHFAGECYHLMYQLTSEFPLRS